MGLRVQTHMFGMFFANDRKLYRAQNKENFAHQIFPAPCLRGRHESIATIKRRTTLQLISTFFYLLSLPSYIVQSPDLHD